MVGDALLVAAEVLAGIALLNYLVGYVRGAEQLRDVNGRLRAGPAVVVTIVGVAIVGLLVVGLIAALT